MEKSRTRKVAWVALTLVGAAGLVAATSCEERRQGSAAAKAAAVETAAAKAAAVEAAAEEAAKATAAAVEEAAKATAAAAEEAAKATAAAAAEAAKATTAAAAEAAKATTAAAEAARVAASELAPAVKQRLEEAMSAYERIRSALAEDKLDGVAAAAAQLAASAQTLSGQLSSDLAAHLSALANEATRLKAARELNEARRVFGEISRHAVALVGAVPSLAEGRRIFECTMVKSGFNRWIQSGPGIGNPYYGSAMQTCGSAVEE